MDTSFQSLLPNCQVHSQIKVGPADSKLRRNWSMSRVFNVKSPRKPHVELCRDDAVTLNKHPAHLPEQLLAVPPTSLVPSVVNSPI
jgi:hypothetical protein